MIQLDFILGPFVICANRILAELDLKIIALELVPEDEAFIFYINDAIDGSEIEMKVPIQHISCWVNARTHKARTYIMDCVIKEVLFDYAELDYTLAYDEIDEIVYLYGDGNGKDNLLN